MGLPSVLPASFRGVPFAVLGNATSAGRRLAEHEYPGRDGLYPEDMGRRGRRYRVTGFIVSDSAVYGGGPVALQRQLLLAAADKKGPGILIHPTLGALTVSCPNCSIGDDLDAGTKAAVEFDFVEYTKPGLSFLDTATGQALLSAALAIDAVVTTAFTIAAVLGPGQSAKAAAVATQWSAQVTAAGQDATSLLNLASQLPGAYGRYFAGGNLGYTGANASSYAGDTTVAQLVSDAAAARAALAASTAAVEASMAALTAATTTSAAAAAQALLAALLAACADPGDALRLLAALAGFAPSGSAAASDIGGAVSDLFRRSAVTGAIRAAQAYQPSSYDDAVRVQQLVTGLLDQELTIAGDEGDDDLYNALQAALPAVLKDLQARGASLAPLQAFELPGSLPSLALAQRLYGDAGRADQLVIEVGPIHPLFMPDSFTALAS